MDKINGIMIKKNNLVKNNNSWIRIKLNKRMENSRIK